MAFKLCNRVKETTTTTGTGSIDLGGAATGFQAFADALSDSDETVYAIVDDPDNPVEYEVGLGTLTTGSPDVLSRDTVYDSSNGGAKINLQSGTTYTVVATTAQEQLPALAADNTFSGDNTFTGAFSAKVMPRANGVLAPHHNLVLQNGSTANNEVDITADGLIVTDASGNQVLLSSVSETAKLTLSGAGGLDTGSEANSTFYHVWIIYDGTNTDALLSTSTTFAGLTLPSGYTYAGYVGAVYNDSSGNFLRFDQLNGNVTLEEVIDADNVDPGSWTAYTVTVPTTAVQWIGFMNANSDGSDNAVMKLAATNDPLGKIQGGVFSNAGAASMPATMTLVEDQTVYALADDATDVDIRTTGWRFL